MTAHDDRLPDGLRLVPLAPEHAATVVGWRMRPANRAMFLGDDTITMSSQIAFTARIRTDPADMTRIAIRHRSPVGMVALYGIGDGQAEYGRVLVDDAARRQGIGRAISGRIVAAGFARLDLSRIHANCLASNVAIHRLLESLGFVRGPVWRHAPSGRDVLRLELDRATWRRHPARADFEDGLDAVVAEGCAA